MNPPTPPNPVQPAHYFTSQPLSWLPPLYSYRTLISLATAAKPWASQNPDIDPARLDWARQAVQKIAQKCTHLRTANGTHNLVRLQDGHTSIYFPHWIVCSDLWWQAAQVFNLDEDFIVLEEHITMQHLLAGYATISCGTDEAKRQIRLAITLADQTSLYKLWLVSTALQAWLNQDSATLTTAVYFDCTQIEAKHSCLQAHQQGLRPNGLTFRLLNQEACPK